MERVLAGSRRGAKEFPVLTHRLATRDDVPALQALADAAIDILQRQHLDPIQVAASRAIMTIDERLVEDGTYFVVECEGRIAGCGGWSRRTTYYTGDPHGVEGDGFVDPATGPARVRAMYTHPDFARRGVARLILSLAEEAAASAGYGSLQLVSTLAGEPLYTRCGYGVVERIETDVSGVTIPLLRMTKQLPSGG